MCDHTLVKNDNVGAEGSGSSPKASCRLAWFVPNLANHGFCFFYGCFLVIDQSRKSESRQPRSSSSLPEGLFEEDRTKKPPSIPAVLRMAVASWRAIAVIQTGVL